MEILKKTQVFYLVLSPIVDKTSLYAIPEILFFRKYRYYMW